MARHRERTNGRLWVLPSLLIPIAIAAAAWTSHVASEGDEIAPNVRFAGLDISGLTPRDVAEQVSDREIELLSTPVIIDLGDRRVVLTADEIGYDYLHSETMRAIVSARHGDRPWSEFLAWATTPFEAIEVSDRIALDEEVARQRLAQEDFVLVEPIEPELSNEDASDMYAVPGTDGVGVDVDHLLAVLGKADVADGPVEIVADHLPIAPLLSDEEARARAFELNEMTRDGMLAVVGDNTARLSPGQIRTHLRSEVTDGVMTFSIDVDGLSGELESAFPEPIGEFIPPRLEVVDGEVNVIAEGEPPQVCCSIESVERAAHAFLAGGATHYQLETRTDDDETVVAWADGSQIKEVVAEFTTNHPCCESRVTNIQTIADTLTGVYLIPGQTLSLNEFVGPRTREKGYVAAGAIRSGYMTEEVGGGVSQFVTTIFNAAFYAGLDLDQYQSHSVYFSRYPFGREATLSIPGPDLVMTNNTEYPILIWPSYTDTSITVTFYSTKNVEVAELEQRVSRRGQCRQSAIDRQRTFTDGRIAIDTIVAFYRPGDGIDCNGNPLPNT